jgi:lipoprotein-anchoring transpeptidase ErfK/SrfK
MRKSPTTTIVTAFLALAGLGLSATIADAANVVAQVDLSAQRMHVFVDGKKRYTWRVSTGKRGWETPPGAYRPIRTYESYFEKKWNMSLPWLVLISHDGIGIHGTGATGRLGSVASHGCIRLHPSNARKFYTLVTSNRMSTSVQVVR